MSLNNEPCMIRSNLIDLNPAELNYHLFMISLYKCNRNYNTVDDLYIKSCVHSKIKDEDVKVFNMMTRINEAKTLVKHISCDFKCKFNNTTCNSNQN